MPSAKNDILPTYLFIFPLFFVFHGFVENFPFISVSSAVLLVSLYTSSLFMIWGIVYLLSKNILASALVSSFVIAFHFFFGAVHDIVKGWAPDSFLTKYSFIIILFILLSCIIFFILRKLKPDLSIFTRYCNMLLPLLLLIDFTVLLHSVFFKTTSTQLSKKYSICDTCKKPDIYVILLDGYSGEEQLQKDFNFSNRSFLDSLKQKGFKIISSSRSNYNYTPFSTASTLNMEYFDTAVTLNNAKDGNHLIMQKLYANHFVSFLRASGYSFYNYSIFNIDGQASPVADAFVPSNTSLITANTFISRFFYR